MSTMQRDKWPVHRIRGMHRPTSWVTILGCTMLLSGGLRQHAAAQTHNPDQPLKPNLIVIFADDPSEKYNVARQHGDVIEEILQDVAEHRQKMVPAPSQLEL